MPTPEPTPSFAEIFTETAFGYTVERQGALLQRMVTVGGSGSGTSVNVVGLETRPSLLVAVTLNGPSGPRGAVVYEYVRLGPDPSMVRPPMVGSEYDTMPACGSVEVAETVKPPLPVGL